MAHSSPAHRSMTTADNTSDDATIHAIYGAAAGMVPWSTPLSAIRRAVGANALQLVVVEKSTGLLVASEQPVYDLDQTGVDGLLEHIRKYHRVDPHMSYVASLPIGQVMHSADAFPREQYGQHPFYREFWSAFHTRSLLAAKVAENERYVAMLGVVRSFAQKPYAEDDIHTLTTYIGHLATAFQITQRLQRVRGAAAAGLALMEASARPMLLLDAVAQIISANSAGRNFLASGNTLFEQGSLIRCRDATMERLLWETLAQMGASLEAEGSKSRSRRAMRISSGDGAALLCSLWALQSDSPVGIFGIQPVALMTIALPDAGKHEALDPIYLGALFDLTPAEVRVATALVAGRKLTDIALAHRTSIETIRSQLKSIYAKTDTHRQAQLLELLLRVAK